MHDIITCMYNGIYNIYRDCRRGKAAGECAAAAPMQRVAGVRCSAGLKRWCCMHGIYTGMLPAGKRERWHRGCGTNERE